MPSLKALRKRIASVKSTKKITSAMKLVAGARLRRAQEGIWAARPYARRLGALVEKLAVVADVSGVSAEELALPVEPVDAEASDEVRARQQLRKAAKLLLHRPLARKVAVVVLTSDRGLCGAFNSNLLRTTDRFLAEHAGQFEEVTLHIVGKKGRDHYRRRKGKIRREWSAPQLAAPALVLSREIAHAITADFLVGDCDAVYLVYNEFKSAVSQHVNIVPLLPVAAPAVVDAGAVGETGGDFKFEPSREAVLAHVVPLNVEVQIYRALLESIASEFGAKLSAMDAATKNATEMIAALTLQFNRARQAAITKELMEIIGGAEALKG